MKQSGCVDVYTDTLKVFLQALNAPVQRQLLHSGVRQFLHRMVVCLEEEVMPFIPVAMERLLENADAKELHDFIPLLNQFVSKFKVSGYIGDGVCFTLHMYSGHIINVALNSHEICS